MPHHNAPESTMTKHKTKKIEKGCYQYRGYQIQTSISDPYMWIIFVLAFGTTTAGSSINYLDRLLSGNVSHTLRGAKRMVDRRIAEGA